MKYRLSITLHHPTQPPTVWKGAFAWDPITGFQLDCPDLPLDVSRAVLAGLRRNGHCGDGCLISGGRYVTYAGKAA